MIPRAELERLWRRDLDLRDKTLWRLLYETAARAGEVLALDVGDLDLTNKRAVVSGREMIHWQAGSAQLLPRLLRGRDAGPVFLAHRRPPPARTPASVDLCPLNGRARLSYRRAVRRHHRLDAAPAAPLRAHPPRRGRRCAAAAGR